MEGRPRVVIVGGGFGGLAAARGLARAPVDVTLVDRANHHLFQPLLYQVATAGLSPAEIASPIRRILRRQANARVLLGEVVAIDPAAKRVRLADGELAYDVLVLAAGAGHSYFGKDEWEKDAPGLKTLEDALEIRRRALVAFEAAERDENAETRRQWLTFVVVGGGPTGVEMAGAFAEIARHTLAGDFRRIDPSAARVILVEGGPRVLPTYPPELSEKAKLQLEALGVQVWTGALVTRVDGGGVAIGADRVAARTVVWAAGVQASPLARFLGVPLDRAGRVRVEPGLTVPGRPEIYVIGDLAALEQDGHPVPGVAPAAIQMGEHAAANVRRAVRGEPLAPFRYRDKGSLATIGRRSAVALIGRLRLSGPLAWLAWLCIHIFFLIGFRNRFVVLFTWAWAYLTYDRSARLIVGRPVVPRDSGNRPVIPEDSGNRPVIPRDAGRTGPEESAG
jgi:NADH:ubiquinone reductase (H+-translocating)